MGLFLSTFENKVDQKGRVSVPSQFRSVLMENGEGSVVLYESSINQCIEGCSIQRIEELSKKIDDLDPFSNEKDAFSAVVLGGSAQLQIDKDGRILLPKNLMDFANITANAVFIGKGQIFEVWEPAAFSEYLAEARNKVKNNKDIFRDGR
ncbi:MAG: division/cell wall cluster transcriptional repressor MraZ [Rickettsiales bacterium]|jgi:MraZ protein|nr:division/cell wall cluster transcriptional repressor MraZ [Rickettsiales bacterium]